MFLPALKCNAFSQPGFFRVFQHFHISLNVLINQSEEASKNSMDLWLLLKSLS